jgi:mRNA interferase RelE/StbE
VKLKRYDNEYRIRAGNYRIRYEVDDHNGIVLLLHFKHRKDATKHEVRYFYLSHSGHL